MAVEQALDAEFNAKERQQLLKLLARCTTALAKAQTEVRPAAPLPPRRRHRQRKGVRARTQAGGAHQQPAVRDRRAVLLQQHLHRRRRERPGPPRPGPGTAGRTRRTSRTACSAR